MKETTKAILREWIESIMIAVVLALFIRTFFVQAFRIPSGSMRDTLMEGDKIMVNKLLFGPKIPLTSFSFPSIREPRRGDIVVFVYPQDRSKDFIKRVVAVGGDTVEIQDKRLIVNGDEQTEPFKQHISPQVLSEKQSPRDNMPPITVPKGFLFVMGDNRDASHDSRFWRFVPIEDVKGKAFMIYYSAQHLPNIRWRRFFKIIR